MDALHFHLAKRGFEHVQERYGDGKKPVEMKIPAWGILLLVFTFLVYVGLSAMVGTFLFSAS